MLHVMIDDTDHYKKEQIDTVMKLINQENHDVLELTEDISELHIEDSGVFDDEIKVETEDEIAHWYIKPCGRVEKCV